MMIEALHSEVVFAAGYAVFLVLAAIGLEWMARFSHRQSQRSKTVGFRYHHHVSAWECSEGNFLWLQEIDQDSRLARYKANAHVCNACGSKCQCTDSDDGRELVHSLNAWTHTEIGQFQRGISLTLIFLAVVILIAGLIRHHNQSELILLGLSMVPVLTLGLRVLRVFRVTNRKISRAMKVPAPLDVIAESNKRWKKRWW